MTERRSYKTRLLFTAGALFVISGLVSPATAGFGQSSNEVPQLMARINELENQIQTLSRTVYRGKVPANLVDAPASGGSSGGAAIANFEVRLGQIEAQQQNITGQIEQVSFDVRELKDRLDRMQSDMDVRLGQSQPTGGTVVMNNTPQPTTSPRDRTPYAADTLYADETGGGMGGSASADTLYETAFSSIREARYAEAEVKFKDFLNKYPAHPLASNAQYWMAESYYVRGDYTKSAKAFAQGYQDYPKSTKAADSLLKLGLSLGKLGKKEDACLSYQQLQKEFPGDTSPVMRRAGQEMKQLGC